jgi:hypothetical protein
VPSLRQTLLEERGLVSYPRDGQRFAERYDIRAVAAQVNDLYETLISVHGRKSGL